MLWQSQELLCAHSVLQGENAIVQLPTGVGKTKSIELIIRAAQLSERAAEIIIIAPLRALCNEITNDLQKAFRKDNVEINQFSDVLEDDYSFGSLSNAAIRISICTPEKFNYIIHHQPEICDMIGLFILDEAHMFDDGTRGVTYEFLVTTIRGRLNSTQQLVLLSAVMTNAEDIRQWLFEDKGVLATDANIVSTPKSVGFSSSSDIAFYSGDPLSSDFFVPRSLVTQNLKLLGRERTPRLFPEKGNARDIAIYYAIRLCKNGGTAVYVDTTPSVRTTIDRVLDIQSRGYNLQNVINKADAVEMEKFQRLVSEYYGKNHPYTNACQYGVLPHHGRLPNGIKLAVEYILRENLAHFVVCTSTLAQGVNIPIRYLLMTGIGNGNSRMNVRSFQNLIGRTARAGMYTEGSIIISNPLLYENRDTAINGGKYKWRDCCNMFSSASAEPCTSSILLLVSDLEIDYEYHVKANTLVEYILNHYAEADCFEVLQRKLIDASKAKQYRSDETEIAYQLLQRKQILEAIENYFCFVYGTVGLQQTTVEIGSDEMCKETLAYYLAAEDQRAMLLSLFHMVEEKVSMLAQQQHMKYSAAMTGVNNGKAIETWILETDLINCTYTETALLQLIVDLYVKLYGTKLDKAEFFCLCQDWIDGSQIAMQRI